MVGLMSCCPPWLADRISNVERQVQLRQQIMLVMAGWIGSHERHLSYTSSSHDKFLPFPRLRLIGRLQYVPVRSSFVP